MDASLLGERMEIAGNPISSLLYFNLVPARSSYRDSTMAGGKKKAGDKKEADVPKGGGAGGKPVKGAQSIFVRHILVRGLALPLPRDRTTAAMLTG